MKKKILKFIEKFFALCAKHYIWKTKPYVIGITGSVGKTSCRMIVYQVLTQFYNWKSIYTSPKNFNSELGLVFSIFQIESFNPSVSEVLKVGKLIIQKTISWQKQYDVIVLEYGVDHPWDMDFLLSIVKPDLAIFTKLDTVHAENFNNPSWIWDEKSKLMLAAKERIYLNAKDETCVANKEIFEAETKLYNNEEIWSEKYSLEYKNWTLQSKYYYKNIQVSSWLLGKENAEYVCLWLDILKNFFWIIWENIWSNIAIEWNMQPWRFSLFEWVCDSILIDSSYNATFASMKQMIENTRDIQSKLFQDYQLLFVIGDMRELWNQSEIEHKKLSKLLKDETVISVWKETKKYFDMSDHANFMSSREAWEYLKDYIQNKSEKYLVLFKWSQNTIFLEEAVRILLKKSQDQEKLPRMNDFWIQKKQSFFDWLQK